jgi:hypothetical protein
MNTDFTVESHFVGKEPVVRDTYNSLIKAIKRFGELGEEPHKTSIHLVNRSAFAGVATRKGYLLLTIKTDYPIDNPRVTKTEQVSRNRFHHLVKLERPEAVDVELLKWLKDAYQLSAL